MLTGTLYLESVPIVNKFPEILLDDLPRVPDRNIDFGSSY